MKNPTATITMQDSRAMTFELFPAEAPLTVSNFADLANSGFYDGLPFHRIVKGFVLQGGSTDGTCESPTDFSIMGEFSENGIENKISHLRGAISMGRYDHCDSAAVQFFIVHNDTTRLDGKYAAFGMMTDGFALLDELADTPTDETEGKFNPPLIPVIIQKIRVDTGDCTLQKPERIIPAVSKAYSGSAK